MDSKRLNEILSKIPETRIAVVGDFFLDRYWKAASELNEPSVETGLTAYQVVETWSSPGAAGTVTNNLAALGVGKIFAVGFVGEDGEGYELQRELGRRGVNCGFLTPTDSRFTPCYTKPLNDGVEMNRFDIKNRTPTSPEIERQIIDSIRSVTPQIDAIMIMDQVSEENCGVVTEAVRDELISLGRRSKKTLIYADSRKRIGQFREMIVKCNDREIAETFGLYDGTVPSVETLQVCGINLSKRTGRTVFITMGDRGQLIVDAWNNKETKHVPAVRVEGEIDICGAGDASSSAIAASLCTGANYEEAAMLGNLASSVTIRKIGQTGTASLQEISDAFKATFHNSKTNI